MKAVVFRGIGEIALDDVPDPVIEEPTDAIVRITATAICGTDLHFVRGTFAGVEPGTVLGHEGIGIIEQLGPDVRNLAVGDRVVIPSTVACGSCSYCRAGYYAQCDQANPNGPAAGTTFFGGPKQAGGLPGMQAERVRVPFAHVGLVKLPDDVADDDAILLSDIVPTGWFGADIAEITEGDVVAVFGCGPVGQFAIAAARLLGAGRVLAIDELPDRLEMARRQGAEVIDFSREDPVEAIRRLTRGIGADRAIDAVGVDANRPHSGPAAEAGATDTPRFDAEQREVAPDADPSDGNWHPGDAPSQALTWAVAGLAKAGTLSIIGVYPPTVRSFPIGEAMNKNLTLTMGNCNHRKYIPQLVSLVQSGVLRPSEILTEIETLDDAIDAYEAFDRRQPGWVKVALVTEGLT